MIGITTLMLLLLMGYSLLAINPVMMQRPDPMIAAKPGAEDVEAMNDRVKWLKQVVSLRLVTDKRPGMHGLFTGLAKNMIR